MLRNILCTIFATLFVSAAQATPAPESFAPILEPLMPAVVNISTTQKVEVAGPGLQDLPQGPQFDQFRDLFRQFNQGQGGGQREVTSLGSGFVIDPSGYVVTNNHVIANASDIKVIFSDNTQLSAKLVGTDPQTDLALLKVKSDKKLSFVRFGDSDALRVGDWVVAVGNPFGLGGSVSAGIVSARSRNINAGPFDDFIQTDAAINRGNSGGPLFNIHGEVVGINSAIFSPTGTNIGIGFAAPSALAKPIIEQLKANGRTQRGWLGVKIQEVSDEMAEALGMKSARGALVLEVEGPSKNSGLEVGDVIVRFGGVDIVEMRKLPRLVAETKPGTKAEIVVWRKGREMTHRVTIGEVPQKGLQKTARPNAPKGEILPAGESVLGMKLSPITPALRAQLDIPAPITGLLVVGLEREGVAIKRGILAGDVIAEVNQTPVVSIQALKAEIGKAKTAGRDYVALKVVHKKTGAEFITIPIK